MVGGWRGFDEDPNLTWILRVPLCYRVPCWKHGINPSQCPSCCNEHWAGSVTDEMGVEKLMPCYDDRDSPGNVAKETRKESRAQIDKLTRLLCLTCRELIDLNQRPDFWSEELRTWWKNHEKVDTLRKERKK